MKIKKCHKGQMFIETAIVLPILLLLLLVGIGTGLSLLAYSQISEATNNASLVGARADACNQYDCPGPQCPSSVNQEVNTAALQTLNIPIPTNTPSGGTPITASPYDVPPDYPIYGVVPTSGLVITTACPNGFYRSSNNGFGSQSGNGNPNPITVTITGDISIAFLPFFGDIPITAQQTTIISPYRSRSS